MSIDSISVEIAKGLHIPYIEHLPKTKSWEGFKERNIKIAEECNELYCISTKRLITGNCYHHDMNKGDIELHQKTAGCYTMNIAKGLNKETHLMLI